MRPRRAALVRILVAGVVVLLFGACQPAGRQSERGDDAGRSGPRTEAVRYTGTLPCAETNCEGIRTELTLHREVPSGRATTYVLQELPLSLSGTPHTETGTWSEVRGTKTDPEAIVYRLGASGEDAQRSFVRAGMWGLRLLDPTGGEIRSPLNYTLVRADLSPTGEPLSVTEAQSGQVIRLRTGQELIAQLAANHAAGYRWTLGDTMEGAIALPDPPTYARSVPAPGAPRNVRAYELAGAETWRFVGLEPGTQVLHLAYRRSEEKNAAAVRSVRFTVTVE